MPFIKHLEPYNIGSCHSPEHEPPSHMYLSPGIHIWECPSCGKQTTVYVEGITMETQDGR